ncbi:hypothetical protein AVEN_84540-1 [Araneus ventricosus]|uniref:Uncharacterized protein n=1 Tax=Araneus ventricosus TaxID=182803 RepID=A0A4Y2F8I7_ARAVE|nr:hypothetical protein AVEN_84540-1 [Araneus ventricosus]
MIRLLRSLSPMVTGIMPISTSDVIELLCTLAEEERLKVTLSESLKGGLITGIAAALGAFLLGPMGLPIEPGDVLPQCTLPIAEVESAAEDTLQVLSLT